MQPINRELEYRSKLLKKLSFQSEYKAIFDNVIENISMLSNSPQAKFSKSFLYNKYIEEKIDAIIVEFNDQMIKFTKKNISEAWNLSELKNDDITKDYINTLGALKGKEVITGKYIQHNLSALEAYLKNDKELSKAIWKVSTQLRGEMKIQLGISLLNGDSAAITSQRIRQYLKDPSALFRRVREPMRDEFGKVMKDELGRVIKDPNGRLIASQAMIENHPGTGRYNSAYKNAMRVTRTEINRAYRMSDCKRYSETDFVMGMEIRLSNNHLVYDICDELAGEYPADFVWTGWHPQCFCFFIPILAPKEDFMAQQKRILEGEDDVKINDSNRIKEMPKNFKKWLKDNKDRITKAKEKDTLPYFLKENGY
jgi:hypothetical protein